MYMYVYHGTLNKVKYQYLYQVIVLHYLEIIDYKIH